MQKINFYDFPKFIHFYHPLSLIEIRWYITVKSPRVFKENFNLIERLENLKLLSVSYVKATMGSNIAWAIILLRFPFVGRLSQSSAQVN